MNRRQLLVLGVVGVLGLRPAVAAPAPLVVLAASSLTETLQQVGAAWTAQGHPAVTFSFDASSRLAKQVEAGAPADAFFSADTEWMDYLAQRGRIDPATRVDLVGNELVVVVPAGGPAVASAAELARPEVRHLALAGENVPAGRYARAALASLGVWEAVQARVVSGDNVRTVLGWVASGEADAGVVYATDVRVAPTARVAFRFPPSSHPHIVYPAAVVMGAAHAADAADFLAYCRSPAGMAVFTAAGFQAVPPGG